MTQTPPSPFATVPRALLAAVVFMGIAIVVGTAVIVGVVIHRASLKHVVPQIATPMQAQTITLPFMPNQHVVAMAARPDGTIAITLSADQGAHVLIWDPATGRIVTTLDLQYAPSGAH